MLDNFELIKPFFDDVGHYTFLHCQIVQRVKEHPNEKIAESAINHYLSYTFRSWEHLLSKRDEIIALCELYGARAYINLSPKSDITREVPKIKEIIQDIDNLIDKVNQLEHSIAVEQAMIKLQEAKMWGLTYLNYLTLKK